MQQEMMNPPWKAAGAAPTMLVVHISAGELEGLDNLQGGPSIDEETGLREYSKLATIIEEPQIRDLFKTVFTDLSDGDLSSPMEKAYQEAKQASLKYQDAPTEHTEPTEDIEKTGRHGDAHMALIPENLALFLVELEHHVSINPETGLLEFWSFKNLVRSTIRVVGTIGGALLGGPIGAGLGNMLGRAFTGQKPGMDMLMAGGKNALFAYGAQGLGQAAGMGTSAGAFGSGVGATGSTLGTVATQGFGPQAYGAYGSLMGKVAPAATTAAGTVAAAAPTAAGTVAAPAASGWIDKLTSVAPWAAMALSAHGQKQHHGDQMKQWEHSQAEKERMREEGGFNIKPRKIKPAKYRENPDYKIGPESSSDQPMYIREGDTPEYAKGGKVPHSSHETLGSYNKGTLIKGPGNGQADKIRTRVPEGSYIIDASTVANFGDGSSESGGKVLKECEALIRKRSATNAVHRAKHKPMKTGGMVDVFLSNDEYKFDPETVTLLGKGSNQQGSKILKSMVKNLRKDKNRNGDRLPPKAKHPMQYMHAVTTRASRSEIKGNNHHAT